MSLSTPPLPSGIPKQRLNHDLNSAWGAILCFDQLQAITPANPLWHEFVTNRLKLEKRQFELSLWMLLGKMGVKSTPRASSGDWIA
ncbi:hypothetical protein HYQ44_020189 [Verticillium longisporum]|nr:hypothetical protein HYQ44_020189 [Verticillium longisporum]